MTEQVRAPATTLTRRPRGEPSSAICRVLTADSGYRHVVNACGREQAGGGSICQLSGTSPIATPRLPAALSDPRKQAGVPSWEDFPRRRLPCQAGPRSAARPRGVHAP